MLAQNKLAVVIMHTWSSFDNDSVLEIVGSLKDDSRFCLGCWLDGFDDNSVDQRQDSLEVGRHVNIIMILFYKIQIIDEIEMK